MLLDGRIFRLKHFKVSDVKWLKTDRNRYKINLLYVV